MANTKIPVELSSTPGIVDGSNATAITIDSSEHVGIGDTSPAEKLEVAGNILASGSDGTARSLTLGNTSGNHSSISVDGSGHLNLDAETAGGLLLFKTAGTERMRIDGSGNVGIGGTPTSKFHILDSSSIHAQMVSSGGDVKLSLVSSDSHDAFINFSGATNEVSFGYDRGTSAFIFSNGDTLGSNERMRITSAGQVYIGLTAQINSSMLSVGDGGVGITYSGAPANYYRQIYQSSSGNLFFYNGSNQGYIDQAGAFNDASDERIKKDIEDISYGLDTVKALKPRKYKMKLNDDEQIGFIAQEVESLVPEIVNTDVTPDGDEQKGMSYGHLTAVLTKAIQEQQTQIEALQSEINTLKGG